MASVVRKLARTFRKRRIKRNRQDGKTFALFDAGLRLLARHDHEHVSMAKLAREAGCSVGALYNRFPHKESFLHHLAAEAFRSLRTNMESLPTGLLWPRREASSMVRQIVSHVVDRMTARKAAGVIRATMKLAPTRPATLKLFDDYRAALTQYAVDVLAPHVGEGGATRVRVAMQIVLATVTDAVLQTRPGPLRAGSSRMVAALSNVMCGYLGFDTEEAWAGNEADGEDEPEDEEIGTEEEPEVPPGHVALFDPDERVYRGTIEIPKHGRRKPRERKPLLVKRSTAKPGSGPDKPAEAESGPVTVPVVAPPRVPVPAPETEKRRPKRRWI